MLKKLFGKIELLTGIWFLGMGLMTQFFEKGTLAFAVVSIACLAGTAFGSWV